MPLPVSKNISLYQGDSFDMKLRLRSMDSLGQPSNPIDLTGATAIAQIRDTAAASSVLTSFTITIPTSTEVGMVYLSLSPTQTASLTKGVYDLQITFADNSVRTLLAGSITVTPDVSRA